MALYLFSANQCWPDIMLIRPQMNIHKLNFILNLKVFIKKNASSQVTQIVS